MRTALVSLVVVGILGLIGFGQQGSPPETFEIPDLELISYAALPDGTEAYTGPVCAAIVLAWFAHHGFPALLPDLNGDGAIDEQDTVELAKNLADEMKVTPEEGANDPWLMDALARYVAEQVPAGFILKIYDDSFEQEYRDVMGRPFDPTYYDGIALELRANVTRDDYADELLAGERVIVGTGPEEEANRFVVGRSFVSEERPEGWPVDVVDTQDDPGQPGPQGQVFSTFLRPDPPYWVFAYEGWHPMEVMFALSPVREPEAGPTEEPPTEVPPVETPPCPPDALAYDGTVVIDPLGHSFLVEECVVREGDHDIYTYTLTNIDYTFAGAGTLGICAFEINNISGITELSMQGPPGWLMFSSAGAGSPWIWSSPPADPAGIMPGQSAQFVLVVPGPTIDVSCQGTVAANCYGPAPAPGAAALAPNEFQFTTTGPDLELVPVPGPGTTGGCPDLVVTRIDRCWEYGQQEEIVLKIEPWVKNVGSENASNVKVCVQAGSASTTITAGLIGAGHTKHLSCTLVLPPNTNFPISITATADCTDSITECNETNNAKSVTINYGDMCQ